MGEFHITIVWCNATRMRLTVGCDAMLECEMSQHRVANSMEFTVVGRAQLNIFPIAHMHRCKKKDRDDAVDMPGHAWTSRKMPGHA